MTYVLDTNIFLHFLVPENTRVHEECKQLMHLVQEKKLVARTASYIFAELVWALESFYKFPRSEINKALRAFVFYDIGVDERVDVRRAFAIYAMRNITFVNALLAAHPLLQRRDAQLVSYDRDFDKLGIMRVAPRDVVKRYA